MVGSAVAESDPAATDTPYARLGGDAVVRAIVERFYDLMEQDPALVDLRRAHPVDLGPARQKLYEYLSGWLGGPPLYETKHGHPRLRGRHLPFSIGITERDQWMAAMTRAMSEQVEDQELRTMLLGALTKLADFMRNRAE